MCVAGCMQCVACLLVVGVRRLFFVECYKQHGVCRLLRVAC